MTREDYEAHKEDYKDNNVSSSAFVLIQDVYIRILEEHLKANDESLKLAMDLSEHMLIELKTERDIKEYLAKELKAKDEEIERLKSYIEKLWQIVDDIDTYGDMAKSNDAMFRSLVENKQKERWELPITTDGYKLIYKESK